MAILLGTQVYPARGDAARRQADALQSWRRLPDVHPLNLQFTGTADPVEVEGFETLTALRLDSVAVSGRSGIRKPIASEVFTVLAAAAADRKCDYFVFLNSDIQPMPALIERLHEGGLDAYAVSRMDVDLVTGRDRSIQIAGIDGFAIRPAWWRAEGWRFRPYVLGEPVWDNVYCAQVLCHGRATLLNREPLLRHEWHPTQWKASPFAHYTQLLSALDAPYFSLWYAYWDQLRGLREAGASAEDELALQRELFVWRPTLRSRVVQLGRGLKAHLRHHLHQLDPGTEATGPC